MNNIQKLRKEKGWTQERLAKEISVSRSTVSMWENGNSNPDNEFLLKLAKVFETSTDALLGEYSPSDEIRHAKLVFDQWLKSTDVTLSHIEERTGTNIQTVRAWANGSGNYFNDKLSVIADLMGCSVDFLIGRADDSKVIQTADKGIFSDTLLPDERELVSNYRLLDKNGKKKAVEYIGDLSGNMKYVSKDKVFYFSTASFNGRFTNEKVAYTAAELLKILNPDEIIEGEDF